jgi:hypothetical protein
MDAGKAKSIEEKIRDLGSRSLEFQVKFNYYVLAIDAAGLGFAVNYNKDAHYSWYLTPFLLAIMCWLVSFYYGMRELQLTDVTLTTNHRYLASLRQGFQKAANDYLDDLDLKNEKIVKVATYKIRFLYVGGLFFIVWYLLKVYAN